MLVIIAVLQLMQKEQDSKNLNTNSTWLIYPETYSLTAYSPEEIYVRKYIWKETPDIVINVLDSTNLERNLFLTTQLIDMDIKVICALNMYDELFKKSKPASTIKNWEN